MHINLDSEQKGADQTALKRADVHLCCSHISKTGFTMTWFICDSNKQVLPPKQCTAAKLINEF